MGKLYLYESDFHFYFHFHFHFHFHVPLWVKFDEHFPEPRQNVFYKEYQHEIRSERKWNKIIMFYLQIRKKDLCTLILQGRQSNKIKYLQLESSLLSSNNEKNKLVVKKFAFQLNQFPTSQRCNRRQVVSETLWWSLIFLWWEKSKH